MTDAELLAEIEATPATPSRLESGVRGVVQGGSLGTSDEIVGALKATGLLKIPQDIRTPGPRALVALYPGVPYPDAASRWFNENRPDEASVAGAESARQEQRAGAQLLTGEERAKNAAAYDAHPGYYMAGAIGGGALPLIATGGKAATLLQGAKETIPAMVRRLAPEVAPVLAQGGVQGLGLSTNDTGTGLLGDIALGVAGGLGGYAFGKLLGQAVQGVGGLAGRRTAAAATRAEDLGQKAAAKEGGVLRGTYGGARQNESRAIEVLLRAESTGALTPTQVAQLAALKASPEWAATVQNVAQNYMDDLPGMLGAATKAKGALQTFDPVAAAAAEKAKQLSIGVMKEQVMARLKRYGPMGAVGGLAGLAFGGSPLSVLLGAGGGAAVRPMLNAGRRMIQHPAVQTAIWSPVERGVAAATTPTMSLLGRTATSAAGMALAPNMSTPDPVAEERAAEVEIQRLLSGSP